jgi:TRAP-type C4-dicarboxylate transport system permease small subunit
MSETAGKQGGLYRVDVFFKAVTKWFSYLGGLSLLFMGIILFINIISAKVFGNAINNVNELVNYLLIAVVYCCGASCQLNEGGMIQVDIFYRKFGPGLQKVIKGVGFFCGFCLYTFAGYQAFSLLNKYISAKTLAAASTASFQIWPFTLLYIVGTFMLALSLLWSVIRVIFFRNAAPVPEAAAEEKPQEGEE